MRGNNVYGTWRGQTQWYGQRTFFDELPIFGATTPYILPRLPMDPDDDNDPAQDMNFTRDTTVAGAEEEIIAVNFIANTIDLRRVYAIMARARLLVECGLDCRITSVEARLRQYNMADGAFVELTAAKVPSAWADLDGPASRQVPIIFDDVVTTGFAANHRLALQVRVLGFRTAGAIAVPAILWHRKGYDDVMVVCDCLQEVI